MRNYIAMCIFILALSFASLTWALELELTGSELTFSYTEPNTNVDGTPLIDLDKTVVFYQFVDQAGAEPVPVKEVPADTPEGGVARTVIFNVPAGENMLAKVDVWVIAYDLVGNASEPSDKLRKTIDHLPPSPPF